MAESLSLSLRAWPTKDSNSESLPYLIPRINEQRGAFRNVTEHGLEEEIRALEAGEGEAAEDGDAELTGDAAEDSKTKREEILAAREDVLKQVA